MGNCLFNGVPDEAAVSKDVTDIIEVVAPNGAASASPEVIWRYSGSGVWKVKLVISAAELAEILASPRATAMATGFSRRQPSEELCRRCGYAARFSR